jgi:uncharacterized membrane protein
MTAVTVTIIVSRSGRYVVTVCRHFAGISYFHLQRQRVKQTLINGCMVCVSLWGV